MASSSVQYYSFFFLLLLCTLATSTSSDSFQPKEKRTHLRLFFHEIESGPNATIYNVVNLNESSPTYTFGDIHVVDSILREGTDTSSLLIGRAQGVVFDVGMVQNAGLSIITLVFTAGEYSGSSVTLLGMIVGPAATERAVVGGTGQFRMARGFTISKLISWEGEYLVSEFNVYVVHYENLDVSQ
ncbi:pterocarpan synthase 1-like [Typha angustifolia]|uniref:pterocarpan synthase 1-like n=1 Tax=Typha angustifolia TaxID=59011 RepID=UPI003C2B40A1